jgi:RNA polymerase sigma factor (TIGR02999 family)
VLEVTRILSEIDAGNPAAAQQLFPLVYDELRKLAAAKLASERPDHTLQATALVHEAYLRLVGRDHQQEVAWNGRGHFFLTAAEAMRRILVENARRKGRKKRGGGMQRHDVQLVDPSVDEPAVDVLGIDEALTDFSKLHPEKAQVVKLRVFGGLSIPEAADALSVSTATVERHWRFARAWLARYLEACPPNS